MQCREHPEGGHHRPAAQVGDLAGALDRRPVGKAGEPQQAPEPEVVGVVTGTLGVGPRLAIARDRAVDDPRVDLSQGLVADAEPVENAGPKALEHDVVMRGQAQEGVAAGVGLQVDADRALAAVERQVERRAGAEGLLGVGAVVGRRPAHVVPAARVLDLDHIGPEVGQQQRAEAARQQTGEIQNPDVAKGSLAHSGDASDVSMGCDRTSRRVGLSPLGTPSISRASATVAGRRPTSSTICRALAIRSPLERAISPLGR